MVKYFCILKKTKMFLFVAVVLAHKWLTDSSQSDGTPAKQKCTLNQGSLSYLAFISAGTKFTDGERVSDSTDANHIWANGIFFLNSPAE